MRYYQLSEAARNVPRILYHGAPLGAVIGILDLNFISTDGRFISFTTNYAVAKSFAHDEDPNHGAVLTFDGQVLSRLANIRRYTDPILADPNMRVAGFRTESEWRTPNDIITAQSALISINVDPAMLQLAIKDRNFLQHDQYLKSSGVSPKQAQTWINQIMHSPLLNKMPPPR